jgi:hypothetical protein
MPRVKIDAILQSKSSDVRWAMRDALKTLESRGRDVTADALASEFLSRIGSRLSGWQRVSDFHVEAD